VTNIEFHLKNPSAVPPSCSSLLFTKPSEASHTHNSPRNFDSRWFQWGAKRRTTNSTSVTTSVTRGSSVTSSWSSSFAPTGSSATPTTPTTKTTPSSGRRFTSLPPFSASAVASSPKAR